MNEKLKLSRKGHAAKEEEEEEGKTHYQCRFQSFWYVTSYDAGIERVHDDHRRHYTNAVDAFDAADVVMPMMPDVASSTLIFSSSAMNCLCLYFLMTSQSLEHELANHNNMDRLKW